MKEKWWFRPSLCGAAFSPYPLFGCAALGDDAFPSFLGVVLGAALLLFNLFGGAALGGVAFSSFFGVVLPSSTFLGCDAALSWLPLGVSLLLFGVAYFLPLPCGWCCFHPFVSGGAAFLCLLAVVLPFSLMKLNQITKSDRWKKAPPSTREEDGKQHHPKERREKAAQPQRRRRGEGEAAAPTCFPETMRANKDTTLENEVGASIWANLA